MRNLIAKDLVEKTEDGFFRLTAPIMAHWIREY